MRDGEQSPGASMTLGEKVQIAHILESLRVDVVEAGFASASSGDFAAVQAVAETLKESKVCTLARAIASDIETAAKAIESSDNKRIHTFIATSPIHMQYKLRMTEAEVLSSAVAAVKLARNFVDDVEFSLEDAVRSEFDFMCRVIEAVIDAGARTINIPDTVGYAIPREYGDLIGKLMATVPNADKAIFSVHCHNDLGLAVANSLSAVQSGAGQVECTINGLGERAGNAALEELVMAIKVRHEEYPVTTNIDSKRILTASQLVSSITGFQVQPNKAIVGANAFAHEAGIHQDGVIKHRETYEIMHAKDVGWDDNKLVLGKHSGKKAVKQRMLELGWELSVAELQDFFTNFKQLADEKHRIFDEDLLTLLQNNEMSEDSAFQLKKIAFSHSSSGIATGSVVISVSGTERVGESEGDGVVDAIFKAIKQATRTDCRLLLYRVSNISKGTDSQAEVLVRIKTQDNVVTNGVNVDIDVVFASARAYVDALNHLNLRKRNPQD